MDYQPHELSMAFPDMSAEQFSRLCADVKANGLLHPIMLFEGKVLDGRHRYRACIKVGAAPRFETYAGDDPVSYVTSENAARRHLTASQIAHAVAAMAGWEREQARKRQGTRTDLTSGPVGPDVDASERGRTAEILANKAGVGTNTVKRAIAVREHGTEALNAKVAAGAITVNEAEKIAKLKPASQDRIAAIDDKRQRQSALLTTMNQSASMKVTRANQRKPRDEFGIRPKFTARFLGRLRSMQASIREDLGNNNATQDDIVRAVLDGLTDEDAMSLEVASPLLGACAVIWTEAVKRAAKQEAA